MLAIRTRIFRELMPPFELISLLNACNILRMVSVSRNTRSLHLHCPDRPVEFYAQRERCTISAACWLPQWCQPRWILLSCSFPPNLFKKKMRRGKGIAALCGRAPLGALPSPFQKNKKRRGKRSRKEITYDHEGCFLDGCLTDYVAFWNCSRGYSHFDFW